MKGQQSNKRESSQQNQKVAIRDFEVLKELGKGGFGSVFLVRLTDQTRKVI